MLSEKEYQRRLSQKPSRFAGGNQALRFSHWIHRKQRNRVLRREKREKRTGRGKGRK